MIESSTLLVVDDDEDVLAAARLLLERHFERVLVSANPARIESLVREHAIDVFLIDMNFAIGRNTGAEGLHWLSKILELDKDAVVVLMTAFGDLNVAVRAMREGAADFVLKPWQNDKLVATLSVAARLRQSRATVSALARTPPSEALIATSPAMQNVMSLVARVAPTDTNVLIRGENGTGKELIARSLHAGSTRAERALVTVDLGAIASSLFESELFGHRRGAFTDAVSDRSGRFQAADGGTLFLDEVGNLQLESQAKLLRAIEEMEVTPLGSDRPVPVDVRLISATNSSLEELVLQGQFREDLLYRINTIEIQIPPLRDRLDDLPALAQHFLELYSRKYGMSNRRISDDGIETLSAHHWPGNIRELSHAIERALILGDNEIIGANDFRLSKPGVHESASLNLSDNERRMVQQAITDAGGNISHAAALLGITRAALYRRIEKFGL